MRDGLKALVRSALVVASIACLPACGDGDKLPSDPPVIGVSFERVEPRLPNGEPAPHKEVTGILFMPRDAGVLIWEKAGRIAHYRFEDGELVLQGELQLDDVYSVNDCGMTSVALDPEWEDNHYLFATHCVKRNKSALVRYEFDGEHYDIADSRSIVLQVGDSRTNSAWHNMNGIGFFDDAEHSMWVLIGEKTIKSNAQDLDVELGKVLRIIPRRGPGTSGYDPHPDNPFAGDPETSSGPNLYAWGLRNPWHGALDRHGRLIIGEVGSKTEEVNLADEPGLNFGWAEVDGKCNPDTYEHCDRIRNPVVSWPHASGHGYTKDDPEARATTMRCAWIGTVYHPNENDPYEGFLDDTILFSDLCLGFVRALTIDDEGHAVRDQMVGHMIGLTGAAQGPDGYLYVTSFGSCTSDKPFGGSRGIYRVLPRTARGSDTYERESTGKPLVEEPLGPFPPLLSETGIFDDDDHDAPIERAVRYEPTLPLWSNGAAKERWLLLPEGKRVDNSDRQAWDFPPGTLFFKTFSYEGGEPERIETRVIRRTESGYDYAAYRWNEDGTDATRLSLGDSTAVKVELADGSKVTHHIPSRFDCRSCHESNDTVIIGFDELRLNGPRSGESGSQLEALERAGVFTDDLPSEPDAVDEADEATREVLGYLHGNCAHCHNSSPETMSVLSLEHDVAFDNLVAVPTSGSGQAHGIRVDPGSPETSILFQALSGETDDDEVQAMPPVGVDRIDQDAVERVRAWIEALP